VLQFKRQHSSTAIRQHFPISSAQVLAPEVEPASLKALKEPSEPAFLS
jgi:hypothetical protein